MSFPWESIEGWFFVYLRVNPFRNGIHAFLTLRRGDHLGEEARREELYAKNDSQEREIEQRSTRHAIDMEEQA